MSKNQKHQVMNRLRRHDWERIRLVPPSGRANAYSGRRCSVCGLTTYPFAGMIRWRYPDGSVHDTATIDEPSCDGRVG